MPRLVYSERKQRAAWAEATDRELLAGMQNHDETALAELIARKTAPLIQATHRVLGDLEEARDVVQMTFVKVWQKRADYDEHWTPNTWIFRIATNLAIDQLRARRTRERTQEPVKHHVLHVASLEGQREMVRVEQREVTAIFEELSTKLTEQQKTIFLLRELEGYSSQEVAKIIGCQESTVRNHLFNARKILRKEVVERYPEYVQSYVAQEVSP